MFPLPLHIWFEIGALLICLVFFRNIRQTTLKWLLPFMLFIVAVELTGRYVKRELGEMELNQAIYNISIPLEYLFYAFIFSRYYQNTSYRKASMIFIAVFPVL